MSEYKRTKFYCGDLPDPDLPIFEGYKIPGQSWNGWEMPYFEIAEAKKLAEWINTLPDYTSSFTPEGSFRIVDTYDYPDEPYYFGPATIETDEGPKVVYDIFASCWTWDEFDSEMAEDFQLIKKGPDGPFYALPLRLS